MTNQPKSEERDIHEAELDQKIETRDGLASAIRARFAPLGGVELKLPPRGPMREPPRFD